MSKNRIALITGANKGLGFETARQLTLRGIKILLGMKDSEKGKSAIKKLRNNS